MQVRSVAASAPAPARVLRIGASRPPPSGLSTSTRAVAGRMGAAAEAALLPCQLDSYLRECDAEVLGCEPLAGAGSGGSREAGKKKGKKGKGGADGGSGSNVTGAPVARFAVTLSRSCLYPEGGGQPADHGDVVTSDPGAPTVAARVCDVQTRAEDGATIHYVDEALPVGAAVRVRLDWGRRFDLMQQHTAQHAFSGLIERRLGLETVSWELSRETVAVDFKPADTAVSNTDDFGLDAAAAAAIEEGVNAAIREAREVRSFAITAATPPSEYPAAMRVSDEGGSRAAFDMSTLDFVARPVLRLVEVDGVDFGPCGGTHVSSLAELQCALCVGLERNRGAVRLRFVAGGRALRQAAARLTREASLCKSFSCAPEDLPERAEVALLQKRELTKDVKTLQVELAEALGSKLGAEAAADSLRLCALHSSSAAMASAQFLGAVASGATKACEEATVVLTASNSPDSKEGLVLIAGPEAAVAAAAAAAAPLVDARGGGKKGRWQGKAARLTEQTAAGALAAARAALASAAEA